MAAFPAVLGQGHVLASGNWWAWCLPGSRFPGTPTTGTDTRGAVSHGVTFGLAAGVSSYF